MTLQDFADRAVTQDAEMHRQSLKTLEEALAAIGWDHADKQLRCCGVPVSSSRTLSFAECEECGRFVMNLAAIYAPEVRRLNIEPTERSWICGEIL